MTVIFLEQFLILINSVIIFVKMACYMTQVSLSQSLICTGVEENAEFRNESMKTVWFCDKTILKYHIIGKAT